MKKLGFIVMPLMAISLLASCNNGGGTPEPSGTFTITLKNDGDFDKKIENVKAGSIVEDIPNPTTPKPDSTFIGWCTDTESKNVFDFSKIKIYQDYTLYSGWKENEPVTYTVTFDAGLNGKFINGEQKISFKLDSGTKLLPYIKALTPTLEGQTFAYYEYVEKDNAIDYDDVVTSDITLKANYFASSTQKTDDLTEFDWKTIKNIAVTGDPSQWFKIGATKKVTVNEKDHTVRIIGFNHDYSELPDEGNPDPNKVLGITFEFANVITDSNGNAVTTIWDGEYKKSGDNYDYRKSVLNTFLNNDVLNMLSSSGDPNNPDLKEVIKQVDKKVGVYNGTTYVATSFDGSEHPYPYLFPLAHDEITSETSAYAPANEGKIYQYYSEHSSQDDRIKREAGSGNGEDYWLRSPYTGSSNFAWIVYDNGHLSSSIVYIDAFAVAPAFCI